MSKVIFCAAISMALVACSSGSDSKGGAKPASLAKIANQAQHDSNSCPAVSGEYCYVESTEADGSTMEVCVNQELTSNNDLVTYEDNDAELTYMVDGNIHKTKVNDGSMSADYVARCESGVLKLDVVAGNISFSRTLESSDDGEEIIVEDKITMNGSVQSDKAKYKKYKGQ